MPDNVREAGSISIDPNQLITAPFVEQSLLKWTKHLSKFWCSTKKGKGRCTLFSKLDLSKKNKKSSDVYLDKIHFRRSGDGKYIDTGSDYDVAEIYSRLQVKALQEFHKRKDSFTHPIEQCACGLVKMQAKFMHLDLSNILRAKEGLEPSKARPAAETLSVFKVFETVQPLGSTDENESKVLPILKTLDSRVSKGDARFITGEDDGNYALSATTAKRLPDCEELLGSGEFVDKLLYESSTNHQDRLVILAMMDEIKPEKIAKTLNIPVSQVYNSKKRITRNLLRNKRFQQLAKRWRLLEELEELAEAYEVKL